MTPLRTVIHPLHHTALQQVTQFWSRQQSIDPLYHHSREEKAESSKGEVCFTSNLPVNAVGSEYIAAHSSKFKKADLPSQGQPHTGHKVALNRVGVKMVQFSIWW